jgi:hypothetical protein
MEAQDKSSKSDLSPPELNGGSTVEFGGTQQEQALSVALMEEHGLIVEVSTKLEHVQRLLVDAAGGGGGGGVVG